ncbi:MAG: ABC transporter ATP-binding protein [Acidobacteriota bacterium]
MIELNNVSFFRHKAILKNINFKINEGDFTILLGPNGAGKTTLLKILAGLIKDYSGLITIKGKNIKNLSGKELASIISFQPQGEEFLLPISVQDILFSGRYPYKSIFSDYNENDIDIVKKAASKFKIEDLLKRDINTLSSGERKKVLISSAYIQDVSIILFDEPLSSMDPEGAFNLNSLLKELKKEKKTILVVTHDINPFLHLANRIIALKDGSVIYNGPDKTDVKVFSDTFNINFRKYISEGRELIIPNEK